MSLPARDIVDVRLSAAFEPGGCPLCVVRARSETAMLDSVIAEHVLDVTFRGELERTTSFCRRHVRELVDADRRGSGGILGSSILYGALLDRRLELVRGALESRGRGRRGKLAAARKRPPCGVCAQGAVGVTTALGQLVDRADDPAWAHAIAGASFCLDDLVALWSEAGDAPAFVPIARVQMARLEDLGARLEGFVDHSAHDRRHALTDPERKAAADAARVLGGTPDAVPPAAGRGGRL